MSWNSHYNEELWRQGTASHRWSVQQWHQNSNDKIISSGRGGCTWWQVGMAVLEWHGAVSRGVQTQDHTAIPFRLGLHWLPEKKARLPFCLLVSTVLVFCSRPCPLQPLGVFDSVASVHCIPCLLGLEEAHLVLPSPHLSDDTHSEMRLHVLTTVLFAATASQHRRAQLPFHEAAAASGPLNHTGYFCFVLSIPLHVYKYPLTLADTSSSPDNPVFSFLLTKMSGDDNPCYTDVIR